VTSMAGLSSTRPMSWWVLGAWPKSGQAL
jgi:hypothetical protein